MKWLPKMHNEKGQGLVEFALVLPILLLIVFGIVDLSRLAYHNALLNQAAKETLRLASVGHEISVISERIDHLMLPLVGDVTTTVSTDADDQGEAATKIILNPANGNSVTAYLTPVYSGSLERGDTIRISLSYEMEFITPIANIFAYKANLKAVYYTRIENPPS